MEVFWGEQLRTPQAEGCQEKEQKEYVPLEITYAVLGNSQFDDPEVYI